MSTGWTDMSGEGGGDPGVRPDEPSEQTSLRLRSGRLELVPMGVPLLTSLLDGDLRRAERLGGFRVPTDIVLTRGALVRRIQQLEDEPELLPWLLRAVVIRGSRTMCGRIGFHSAPGPEDLVDTAADGVELGYEIDPRFRRRGYAREAALTLMRWAYERHGQRCFVLSIAPTNTASLAMASAMGFRECGSRMDEEDGIELTFLRRLDGWPAEWAPLSSVGPSDEETGYRTERGNDHD